MDRKTVATLILFAAGACAACPLWAEEGAVQAASTLPPQAEAADAPAAATAAPQTTGTPQMMLTATPAPTATPSPTPFTPQLPTQEELDAAGIGDRILMRGLEGSDVALMQQRLYDLGYYAGEIDGKFGLQTRTAVRAFQRAHGLEKIDGKAGPETLGRLFSEDVILQPTPTPSPTPTPTPSPTPSPTPVPTPVPTATPDVANAPFAMESASLTVAGTPVTLMIGVDEAGERLYPLCGIAEFLRYEYAYNDGAWQLIHKDNGTEIAVMTQGESGLCEGAMIACSGKVILSDAQNRVYAYAGEVYVTAPLLSQLGFIVQDSATSAAGV